MGSCYLICLDVEEIGTCDCWGDPHCTGYDKSVIHFMGECSYIMSRDGCVDGLPEGERTFELQQVLWHRPGWHNPRVTFVKEVNFIYYDMVIIIVLLP